MRYAEYRQRIADHLAKHAEGATWRELQEALDLPYERPCPEWTRRLQSEIGLVRCKGEGRALMWRLSHGLAGA